MLRWTRWPGYFFFILISPAWASVTVHYTATQAQVWEIKNGHLSLKIRSPRIHYNDTTSEIEFENPVGTVFDETGKLHHFQANWGTFWPKNRALSLQDHLQVHTHDQGVFTAEQATVLQDPFRVKLSEQVNFEQTTQSPSAQKPTRLSLKADRALVYPSRSEAHFEGRCQTQFIQEDPFTVTSKTAALWGEKQEALFQTRVALKHARLQGTADTLKVVFEKSAENPPTVSLKTLLFQDNPLLKFDQEGDQYTILGQEVSVVLGDQQSVQHIQAKQNVHVTLPQGTGYSQKFDYDITEKLLTFLGQPATLTQKQETFTGQHIRYHSETQVIEVVRADITYKDKEDKHE